MTNLCKKPYAYNRLVTQRGVTMIELIISIVIIAIAVSGVLLVINQTTSTSADPMIRTQATSIAQSYMEEIMLLAYQDPDGNEAGETRATYDDVDDYNGLSDSGARDQTDTVVSGLESYLITISVTNENLVFAGLAAVAAKRIDIIVSHPAGVTIPLTAYRTDY